MKRWLIPLGLVAACSPQVETGPVRVSVIGGPPTLVDPNRRAPDESQRVLLGAVAQGLVAFDEEGNVDPALAQRWIVTSDGLSAIFRLRRAAWPDGKAITSADAARRVKAMLADGSRNPLRPAFDSIDEINPTTPEVFEVRLTTPRPPLLELLAQPEAVLLSRTRSGAGPYRIGSREGDSLSLVPREAVADDTEPKHQVRLTGERAARAIVRFRAGRSDLVLGGGYRDWPLLQAAKPQQRTVRLDPAEGLFGLSVVRTEGFLSDPANRQVLAMAIDRDALLATFAAPGWQAVLTALPRSFRSASPPTLAAWAALDMAGRQAEARRRVAAWTGERPIVRVALPDGSGSTLLFARLAADWRAIGVDAVRSDTRTADLILVDRVAPAGSAIWYLGAIACPTREACSNEARDALTAARASQSLVERGTQLAIADRAVSDSGLWVPLARPLRWSLVSPRLTGYRDNVRAWHPLHRLLVPRRR